MENPKGKVEAPGVFDEPRGVMRAIPGENIFTS